MPSSVKWEYMKISDGIVERMKLIEMVSAEKHNPMKDSSIIVASGEIKLVLGCSGQHDQDKQRRDFLSFSFVLTSVPYPLTNLVR